MYLTNGVGAKLTGENSKDGVGTGSKASLGAGNYMYSSWIQCSNTGICLVPLWGSHFATKIINYVIYKLDGLFL